MEEVQVERLVGLSLLAYGKQYSTGENMSLLKRFRLVDVCPTWTQNHHHPPQMATVAQSDTSHMPTYHLCAPTLPLENQC